MQKRTGWILRRTALVGPAIGFLLACVVTYVMPKKYESEAIIQVWSLGGASPPAATTPQFFDKQFEMITNHDSLAKVVDRLQLVNKWSVDKETAIRILKESLNTKNVRGTDLISIRARHVDREDARNITAEVVQEYREYRRGILIHDDPKIAEFPISPNVIMNLFLGAEIGFILSPLMALPLVVLLNRLNPVRLGLPSVHPG